MNLHFIHQELKNGIYFISAKEWEEPTSSTNCWLIQGKEHALLIDAGLPCTGLKKYIESWIQVPIILCLSHGHYDHIGAMNEFEDVYFSKKDEYLFEGIKGLPKVDFQGRRHYIKQGYCFDLGNRTVEVYELPGHTPGSLVFLESFSHILFSGDAIARRGFILEPEKIKVSTWFEGMLEIEKLEFNYIASSHDRYFLKKEQIQYFIKTFISLIDAPFGAWKMPSGIEFYSFHAGTGIDDDKYLTISLPVLNYAEVKEDVLEWGKNHDYR